MFRIRREFPSFLFAHLTFPVSRNWETVETGKVKCAKAVKLGICSCAKSVPALKLGKCENCGVLGNWESVKLGNCKFSPEAVKAGNETGELSDTELGNSKIDGRQTKLGKSISLDPTLQVHHGGRERRVTTLFV